MALLGRHSLFSCATWRQTYAALNLHGDANVVANLFLGLSEFGTAWPKFCRHQNFEYVTGTGWPRGGRGQKNGQKITNLQNLQRFWKKNTNKITRKKPHNLKNNGQSCIRSNRIDSWCWKSLKLGSMLRKGINRCGKTINCIILSNCLFFSNQKIQVAANIISIKVPKKEETEYTLHGEIGTWWFQPVWKISVKLDHFPNFRDEQKFLKPAPRNPSTLNTVPLNPITWGESHLTK